MITNNNDLPTMKTITRLRTARLVAALVDLAITVVIFRLAKREKAQEAVAGSSTLV